MLIQKSPESIVSQTIPNKSVDGKQCTDVNLKIRADGPKDREISVKASKEEKNVLSHF